MVSEGQSQFSEDDHELISRDSSKIIGVTKFPSFLLSPHKRRDTWDRSSLVEGSPEEFNSLVLIIFLPGWYNCLYLYCVPLMLLVKPFYL